MTNPINDLTGFEFGTPKSNTLIKSIIVVIIVSSNFNLILCSTHIIGLLFATSVLYHNTTLYLYFIINHTSNNVYIPLITYIVIYRLL